MFIPMSSKTSSCPLVICGPRFGEGSGVLSSDLLTGLAFSLDGQLQVGCACDFISASSTSYTVTDPLEVLAT